MQPPRAFLRTSPMTPAHPTWALITRTLQAGATPVEAYNRHGRRLGLTLPRIIEHAKTLQYEHRRITTKK